VPETNSYLRYKLIYLLASLPGQSCAALLDNITGNIEALNPELKKLAYLGLLSLAPSQNFFKEMRCRDVYLELDRLAWNNQLV